MKNYDYSQNGAYYLTICTNNRKCLFEDDFIKQMVYEWWQELSKKFSNVELDEFVVMPNHLHGIVVLVGADLCVCPSGGHGRSIPRIVQWFKTMTTNQYIKNIKKYGWKPFDKKLWQRNYYEHVIRNDDELNRIREYIMNNPLKWEFDENNPINLKTNSIEGRTHRFAPTIQ